MIRSARSSPTSTKGAVVQDGRAACGWAANSASAPAVAASRSRSSNRVGSAVTSRGRLASADEAAMRLVFAVMERSRQR